MSPGVTWFLSQALIHPAVPSLHLKRKTLIFSPPLPPTHVPTSRLTFQPLFSKPYSPSLIEHNLLFISTLPRPYPVHQCFISLSNFSLLLFISVYLLLSHFPPSRLVSFNNIQLFIGLTSTLKTKAI